MPEFRTETRAEVGTRFYFIFDVGVFGVVSILCVMSSVFPVLGDALTGVSSRIGHCDVAATATATAAAAALYVFSAVGNARVGVALCFFEALLGLKEWVCCRWFCLRVKMCRPTGA